jgi:very-long-chain enoyl-CoA reductase
MTHIHKYRQGLKLKQDAPAAPSGGAKSRRPPAIRLNNYKGTVGDYAAKGVVDGSTIEVKDMGPQFSYRGVFIVEYLGPILIVALYAMRPAWIYGEGAAAKPFSLTAKVGIAAWILHFVKRELETFFVHRFSRPTMPLSNLFKNSIYYWSFAAMVGYPLCHPLFTDHGNEMRLYICFGLMAAFETINFLVHVHLRGLRKEEGSDARPIPKGPLFSLVSCPNYTAEVAGWLVYSVGTSIALSYVFTLVGFLQMTQWALGKHKGYRKTDSKLRRKAIVPFLI